MSSSVSGRREAAAESKAAERITAPVRWGEPPARVAADGPDLLPPMSWDQLESVLTGMAVSPDRAMMVRHLLAGARRDAGRQPAEETIRDILCIGAAAVDPPAPSLT